MEQIRKVLLFLPITAGVLVLCFPEIIADGVRQGVSLCILTVIPSLFLFMIFAEWLSRYPKHPAFFLFKPLCRFLSLPENTAAVLAVGMVGGYPAGGKMLSNLVRRGELDPDTAAKVLVFTYQCSPAFLVAAIGSGVFRNPKTGLLIYFSQVIASLLIVKALNGKKNALSQNTLRANTGKTSLTVDFVESVSSAGKAVGVICIFVTAFSALKSLLEFLFGAKVWFGLLEVSVGIDTLKALPFQQALFWSMLFTSFGGICVLSQVSCFTSSAKIRLRKLLLTRPVHFLFSYGLLRGFLFCFPKTAEVFYTFTETEYQTASASVTASALLIALCFMLLISDRKYDKI